MTATAGCVSAGDDAPLPMVRVASGGKTRGHFQSIVPAYLLYSVSVVQYCKAITVNRGFTVEPVTDPTSNPEHCRRTYYYETIAVDKPYVRNISALSDEYLDSDLQIIEGAPD